MIYAVWMFDLVALTQKGKLVSFIFAVLLANLIVNW